MLPRWLGGAGHLAGLLHLLDQGEVLATAAPGFPVREPAGPGSAAWGLWVAALGVTVLRRSPVGSAPGTAPVSRPGPRTSSAARA